MSRGRIDVYLDLASMFSYVCFVDLQRNLEKLTANAVEVEFHPIFLGGINNLSGNKPPWTLEAKAKYLVFDGKRAADRVGITYQTPDDLFERAKTQSALRALLFIKAEYPKGIFLSALHFLFYKFWTPPNADVVDEDNLKALLLEATEIPGHGAKLFTDDDVQRILKGRSKMKQELVQNTGKVVATGAFGCPWIIATNSKGVSEPFFGSDRFNHIYAFLGVEFQDIEVLQARPKI